VTSLAQREPLRAVLVPRAHEIPEGAIPYYDHELDVPQSTAHRDHVYETGLVLSHVAKEAGLLFKSDEPIWYLHPENDAQRVYYGDFVFAEAGADNESITAASLLLVIEVVSTNDRRRELKDTQFSRLLNERNAVPELGLIFPELEDARALTWFELVGDRYHERIVAPGGSIASRTVPGLELRVLPRDRWQAGYKVDVYYRGELRPRFAVERQRALDATRRADEETRRADEETRRADEEARRADEEARRADEETRRADEETRRADEETRRADEEARRAARLAARLRELGVEPDA